MFRNTFQNVQVLDKRDLVLLLSKFDDVTAKRKKILELRVEHEFKHEERKSFIIAYVKICNYFSKIEREALVFDLDGRGISCNDSLILKRENVIEQNQLDIWRK